MSLLNGSGDGGQGGNASAGAGNSGAADGGGAGAAAGGQSGGTGGTGGNTGGAANSGNSSSGGGQSAWFDSLPDDLKSNPVLKQFGDVSALAKSWVHAQSQIGKKGVIPPGEKATDEETQEFYKALGVPPLEKYEVKAPENANKEFVGGFKELAQKTGLLPKQAQALMDWYAKSEQATSAANSTKMKEFVKAQGESLKREWGEGYPKQLALAQMGVREVGGEEFQKYLQETGLGNDIQLVKAMAKVGKLLGEDKLRGDGGGNMGQTPGEIQNEISKLRAHPAYLDGQHGQHKSIVAQVDALYQRMDKSQSA